MASCYRMCAAFAACFIILLGVSPALHAQSWQWVQLGSGSGNDLAGGVALDTLGNAYVVGTFQQNIAFNATIFTNGTATGLFIAKYNAGGILQWAMPGLGAGNFLNASVAVSKGGEVYITGSYLGTVRIGADTLRSINNTSEGFVARINPLNGATRWIRRTAYGPGNASSRGVAVDDALNCYITGFYADTISFDTAGRRSVGGNDVFVAKYNATGIIQWVGTAGGGGNDEAYGIGVDGNASCYVAGRFDSTAYFGLDTMISAGGTDIFAAKFTAPGQAAWATPMGGPLDDAAWAVAVDKFGNAHLTGSFRDTAYFDTTRLVSNGGADIMLAKVDGVGTVRWARSAGSARDDNGAAIALDDVGSVFVTGHASDTATFGNVLLPIVPNNADVFVTRYDGTGLFQWVRGAGGPGADMGGGLAVDRGGELRVVGSFSDTANFGAIHTSATGGYDLFVGKLGSDPTIGLGLILDETICAGDHIQVPFTVKGVFGSGNYYIAQLSDTAGSFANPLEIGRIFGIGGTTIVARIPDTIAPSTRYRIRVVSTVPVVASAPSGKAIAIYQTPKPLVTPGGPIQICKGDSVILDAGPGFSTYVWNSGDHVRRIVVKASGEFSVTVSNERGCIATSPTVVVVALTAAKPAISKTGPVLESTPAVTYQWYFANQPISGATQRTLNPAQEGFYRVRIVDSNGCSEISDPFDFTFAGVAYEHALEGVQLYPHPNHGVFTVAIANARPAHAVITVVNAVGQSVARFDDELTGGDYSRSFDVRELPNGLYFVRVESNGRGTVLQMLKQ